MRGVGTDILEITRIAPLLARPRFLARVYTDAERDYLRRAPQPAQSAAGLFCAKEAVAKALGCGFGAALSLRDIEVTHEDGGAPRVHVAGRDALSLSLSISHCHSYATATAILWEGA